MQSCRTAGLVTSSNARVPVIQHQRDGKERPHLETLQIACEDPRPKRQTVLNIFKCIEESGALEEPYSYDGSNCQDFARFIWHHVSENPYPNPAR